MGSNNKNLHKAKVEKNDEFYTLYKDIEKEVSHYKEQLIGKDIYCNCDTPQSNFYIYFKEHFNDYKIKSLTATGYNKEGNGTYAYYNGENETITSLTGNGSYDSTECLEILNTDPDNKVVITNPPFSKFRGFYSTITGAGVDFLVVANTNAVTYKDVFPDIKEGRTRVGYNYGNMWFRVPDTYELYGKTTKVVDDNDPKYR